MYYLLGYKLVAQPLDARRKQTIADNTFILALDGDVDFKPSAVQLLVDRMRKNEKVGAACGRIHHIGTGKTFFDCQLKTTLVLFFFVIKILILCFHRSYRSNDLVPEV